MLSLNTPEELINHMKKRNIKFDLLSEEEAIKFLQHNTYYKKISSYKKNFLTYIKDGEKQYRDLDFGYLKELSSIDVELRQIILMISLNVEHSVKVKVVNKCLEMKFDGYDIVEDFFQKYPKVRNNIMINSHNSYCEELINQHQNRYPIWVVVEVISFGDLCLLYKFMVDRDYFGDHKKAAIRDSVSILYSVHNLRNAAAHNHCLIRDLRYGNDVSCEHMISQYVANVEEIGDTQRRKALTTRFYHDFTCLLYSIDYFIESDRLRIKAKKSIKDFIEVRAIRNKQYFVNSIVLKNVYHFFRKVVDMYVQIE